MTLPIFCVQQQIRVIVRRNAIENNVWPSSGEASPVSGPSEGVIEGVGVNFVWFLLPLIFCESLTCFSDDDVHDPNYVRYVGCDSDLDKVCSTGNTSQVKDGDGGGDSGSGGGDASQVS